MKSIEREIFIEKWNEMNEMKWMNYNK
jgi:hypothetical protein